MTLLRLKIIKFNHTPHVIKQHILVEYMDGQLKLIKMNTAHTSQPYIWNACFTFKFLLGVITVFDPIPNKYFYTTFIYSYID
jgi:hypothetical protein